MDPLQGRISHRLAVYQENKQFAQNFRPWIFGLYLPYFRAWVLALKTNIFAQVMMIFPWKTHCLAVCRRDGRMQKKMKFSRFWQFDRCQVWLQSGLTAVRSDCCQIRQLSANACRIFEFQFLSPPWFFTAKFLDFIFLLFGKEILTKKWVVKNHGGLS